MAKVKVDRYSFNKTLRTIRFNDYTSIRLDGILLITNVMNGTIIYNFADPLKGGAVTNNVLTLTYDTSSMNDDDLLMIYYDDSNPQEVLISETENRYNINVASEEAIILLRRMVKLMESQGITDTAQRQRVSVDNTVAITANQAMNVAQVGGVATLMNLGLSGTGTQRVTVANDSQIDNVIALWRTAYNTGLRDKLVFS